MVSFIELVSYLLFGGRLAFVLLPVTMVTLILIDPFVGRVIGLLIMSALLTFSTPRPYRVLPAAGLPQIAFLYALGDRWGAMVALCWAVFVVVESNRR